MYFGFQLSTSTGTYLCFSEQVNLGRDVLRKGGTQVQVGLFGGGIELGDAGAFAMQVIIAFNCLPLLELIDGLWLSIVYLYWNLLMFLCAQEGRLPMRRWVRTER